MNFVGTLSGYLHHPAKYSWRANKAMGGGAWSYYGLHFTDL